MESARGRFAVINLHALQSIPLELTVAMPMNYVTEDLAQRVARRERVWSPATYKAAVV
jgi:hypothetical protein